MQKGNWFSRAMDKKQVLGQLESMSDPKNVEGMARFGINPQKLFGISIPPLRKLAKEIGKNHQLALELWDSGYHEARILASMIDEVDKVTEGQMEKWVADFDSWDVCDQTCMNLFVYTDFVSKKAIEWSSRDEEFVKRAGFALMACLAWKIKDAPDDLYDPFYEIMIRESTDNRNFVKKAVNWALRQIGKRNLTLNKKAIETARQIQKIDNKAAKWIANDALKELTSDPVRNRLGA